MAERFGDVGEQLAYFALRTLFPGSCAARADQCRVGKAPTQPKLRHCASASDDSSRCTAATIGKDQREVIPCPTILE